MTTEIIRMEDSKPPEVGHNDHKDEPEEHEDVISKPPEVGHKNQKDEPEEHEDLNLKPPEVDHNHKKDEPTEHKDVNSKPPEVGHNDHEEEPKEHKNVNSKAPEVGHNDNEEEPKDHQDVNSKPPEVGYNDHKEEPEEHEDVMEKVVAAMAPDGGWGWLVVLASFLNHVVIDGIVYSLGLFYVEFLDDFNSAKGETSVVASLLIGAASFSGPLAGALVNQYQCRVTAILGAVIMAIGLFISAWAPNIYFLYFSIGILSGIGYGLLLHSSVVIVGQYFDRRRSLATGIAVCGAGLGMFVFPPIIHVLVEAYAWQGASIVLAGFLLNLCISSAVFRPLKPTILHVRKDDSEVKLEEKEGDENRGAKAFLKKLKQELKTTTNFRLLRDIPFFIFAISGTIISLGFQAPFIFVPHLAELNGVTDSDATMLISIIGITNLFGRVAFGFIGDRMRKRRLFLFCGCTVFTGLFTTLCPLCTTYTLMAIYAAFFGFAFGGIVALKWVLLPDLMGVDHFPASLGICMLFHGFTTPVGPAFLGWLFDITGNYDASFIIGGVTILISGLILMPIPCIRSKALTSVLHPKDWKEDDKKLTSLSTSHNLDTLELT